MRFPKFRMCYSSLSLSLLNRVKKKCPVGASTMGSNQPRWCNLPMAAMPICLETMAQRMTCQRRMGRAMSCGHVEERGCGGAPPERGWRISFTLPEISRRVTPWTALPCSTIAQYVCVQFLCQSFSLGSTHSTFLHLHVEVDCLLSTFVFLHCTYTNILGRLRVYSCN